MRHIPSTDAEWLTAAWLLRRALWTGRPLGPLETEDLLFEHAEGVMVVADRGPHLWSLMAHKVVEIRDAQALGERSLALLLGEVRQHSGAEAVEVVRAAWTAHVNANIPWSDSQRLDAELLSTLMSFLPPVSPGEQLVRALDLEGTLSEARDLQRDRANVTAMVQRVEDQLHRHTRVLSVLYPSAVEAVLATHDAGLCQALLIDFATPDGQSRHNAMGGQFPDLQDDLRAIHQPRVKANHADTPAR